MQKIFFYLFLYHSVVFLKHIFHMHLLNWTFCYCTKSCRVNKCRKPPWRNPIQSLVYTYCTIQSRAIQLQLHRANTLFGYFLLILAFLLLTAILFSIKVSTSSRSGASRKSGLISHDLPYLWELSLPIEITPMDINWLWDVLPILFWPICSFI